MQHLSETQWYEQKTKARLCDLWCCRGRLPPFCLLSNLVWSSIDCSLDFHSPCSAAAKYEFYDEALIIYVIANYFFASPRRLCEQIPVLLQWSWNIHGHIIPLILLWLRGINTRPLTEANSAAALRLREYIGRGSEISSGMMHNIRGGGAVNRFRDHTD